MDLKDLVKSVTAMSDEELLEHITRIRSQRVIRAIPAKRASAARVKSKKGKDALSKLMETLSPEMKKALMEKFGGDK
jgi:hypothetical protein